MASTAELAHGEKLRTQSIIHPSYLLLLSQSLNQSPSLFDAPGTEAFASELFNMHRHTLTVESQLK